MLRRHEPLPYHYDDYYHYCRTDSCADYDHYYHAADYDHYYHAADDHYHDFFDCD